MRKIQICVDSLCEGVFKVVPQTQLQFTIVYDPQQVKLHIETVEASFPDRQAGFEDSAADTLEVTRMILDNIFDSVSINTADGKMVLDLEAHL